MASAPPPAAKPLAPAARNPAAAAPAPTVGIAGVGKGEDSPDSKGAKAKRQAISTLDGKGEVWIFQVSVFVCACAWIGWELPGRSGIVGEWAERLGPTREWCAWMHVDARGSSAIETHNKEGKTECHTLDGRIARIPGIAPPEVS